MKSVIYWIFLASGAAGLMYEVVWMRMLQRVLGATVFAYTIVLSAFMLGLALGGWYFGRRIDVRGRPLLIYAGLEVGIGLWAIIFPSLIGAMVPLFAFVARGLPIGSPVITVARSVFAFLALLVPTILMGGTLPVLSKFAVEASRELGQKVAQLYAVNTFGAILGAGAAGFYLIGQIGEIRTTAVAIILNFSAAALAALLLRATRSTPAPAVAPAPDVGSDVVPTSRGRDLLLLTAVGLTGATMLAYEVLWTRTGVLLVQNTTYSFSLMLIAFLTGIALGSAIMAAAFRSWRPDWPVRWRLFAGLQFAIGLVALFSFGGAIPVVAAVIPFWRAMHTPLAELVSGPFPAIFVLLAPLTLLSGACFPLAASLYARELSAVGRGVGAVYLWNTIGAAVGSAAAGFLLLPALGIAHSFIACIALNLALGLAVISAAPARFRQRARSAGVWLAISVVSIALVYQATDGLDIPRTLLLKRLERPYQKNIFYQEDINGIVSVWINPLQDDPWLNNKRLYIDGQPMASAYRYGMIYERLQAHYPLLLHSDPKDALVICLGTGTTLGSAGQYPLDRIDCVELSRSVVEAGVMFREQTHNILEDPRVTVYVDDGRNYLLTTGRRYDVITAEPMHPHLAGTVNLYTPEYFRLVKNRLRPGGVCSHWIPLHMMRAEEVKAAVQAFRVVFPHTLFFLESADGIILGSEQPLAVDLDRWRRLLDDPEVSQDLVEVGLDGLSELLATYMMDDAGLAEYAGGAGPVTDDLPTLEFFGSFGSQYGSQSSNIREVLAHRDPLDQLRAHLDGRLTPEESAQLEQLYPVEAHYLMAYADYAAGDWAAARDRFEEVLEEAPNDRRAEIALNAIDRSISAQERSAGFAPPTAVIR